MTIDTTSIDSMCCLIFYFFFFQAEDGIRDLTVTGVQTCALPISRERADSRAGGVDEVEHHRSPVVELIVERDCAAIVTNQGDARSEERRVGKECRSRWSAYN